MRFEDYIEIRPGVRAGKPCFKGTRITVYDVLEYLAGEMTRMSFWTIFRCLTKRMHISAARAYSDANESRLPKGSRR